MTPAGSALRGRDLALVLLVALAWAGNFLTSALAMREIPPVLFTALRFAVLGLALVWFLKPPPREQWPRLLTTSLLIGVLHFSTSFWALHLAGNLSSPAIVMQSYVPMTTLLAWWWLGERFGWRTGLGIAISFLGVLVLGLDPMVVQKPAALLVMLLSAMLLAVATVLMKGLRGIDMWRQQGWMAVLSVGPLLLASAWLEPGALARLPQAGAVAWIGVLYAALVSSLLGHGLYYVLVRRHPVAQVTPWLLLVPAIAVGLGIAFYGDRPGPRLWLGGAMVLGGVLAVAIRARVRQRPLPAAEEI